MKLKWWTFRLKPVDEGEIFRGKDIFTLPQIVPSNLQSAFSVLLFAKG